VCVCGECVASPFLLLAALPEEFAPVHVGQLAIAVAPDITSAILTQLDSPGDSFSDFGQQQRCK